MGKRRRLATAAIAGGLAMATTVTALFFATHAQTATTLHLPRATVSSEQVLRAYLRAATAHECDVTEALTDPAGGRDMAWCGGRHSSMFNEHPDLLSYKNIGAVSRVSAAETGRSAEECIPVDITQTNMNGADPGVMRGWQFCFRHTPSGWRLVDQGYG